MQTPITEPTLLPINRGSRPDYALRLGYPRLFNLFIGKSGHAYHTPGLELLADIANIRDVVYTPFNSGYYFVVTNTQVFRVSLGGAVGLIADIVYSGRSVVSAQNQNNQIAFCDGRWGYVYDQNTNEFIRLDSVDTFDILNPIGVCLVNNFMVWINSDGKFQTSSPNNALLYDPEQSAVMSGKLTKALGVYNLINNLYIVGTTGAERWVALQSNAYDFPFTKDPDYRAEYGGLSSASIINAIDNIYLLSSKKIPMRLNSQGIFPITGDEQDLAGFANLITSYEEKGEVLDTVEGSFFSFNGQFFYCLSFHSVNIAWLYCENSNTFSESDDLIVSAAQNSQVVATQKGLYTLTKSPSNKHRQWRSDRVVKSQGLSPKWNKCNGCEMKLIEGEIQPPDTELLYLSVSFDSKSFSNSYPVPMGKVGERNAKVVWGVSFGFPYECTYQVDYYGSYPLVLESFSALIK